MKLFLVSIALALLLTPSPSGDKNAAAPVTGTPVLEVLFPPSDSHGRNYEDVQTYLLNKNSPAFPLISGAVIQVAWSDFDLGDAKSGTHTKYDFKLVDDAMAPWIAAGKFANIVLSTTPYGAPPRCPERGSGSNGQSGIGNCAMPAWMWTALGESNFTSCDGAQVPNFISNAYVTNYQAAMSALIQHYASTSRRGLHPCGTRQGR